MSAAHQARALIVIARELEALAELVGSLDDDQRSELSAALVMLARSVQRMSVALSDAALAKMRADGMVEVHLTGQYEVEPGIGEIAIYHELLREHGQWIVRAFARTSRECAQRLRFGTDEARARACFAALCAGYAADAELN